MHSPVIALQSTRCRDPDIVFISIFLISRSSAADPNRNQSQCDMEAPFDTLNWFLSQLMQRTLPAISAGMTRVSSTPR